MVDADIHTKLELILKEMEREFIMLRFKFGAPGGKFKNEIRDVPGTGSMTTHLHRDKLIMEIIREKMCKMRKLLSYSRDQITRKRMAAVRQHYFVMVHKNRGLNRMRNKNWSVRSANFCAGKFLIEIFDKHISRHEILRD